MTWTFSSFCALGATCEQSKPICDAIRPLFVTFDPNFPFHKFIFEDIAKTNEISLRTKIEHSDLDFFFILCNGSWARTIEAHLQCNTTGIYHFDPRFLYHKFIFEDIARNNEISVRTKIEHSDQDYFIILCNWSCVRTIKAYLRWDKTVIYHFRPEISISQVHIWRYSEKQWNLSSD